MAVQLKDIYLIQCRQDIEQQIGLGPSDSWTTADFERLSEAILSKTGVCLSVTTLKRVWGKIRYDSSPTTTTLNGLVNYLGYANWHDFIQASAGKSLTESKLPIVHHAHRQAGLSTWLRLALPAAVIVCLLGLIWGYNMRTKTLLPDNFSFDSHPVTKGVPNSVVFDYDARASPTDSIFIQQSWDSRRHQLVSKTGHQHTSIYYHPGYFRAKLVVGEQVVKEHDLMIPSDGWHVAVLQEPIPVYFEAADVTRYGRIHLPVSLIRQHNIPLQPHPPIVRYRYINELSGIQSDNFVLETRFRNEYNAGASICHRTRLMIHGKKEVFMIPLSAKGCVSDLYLMLAGHKVDGSKTDLSAFGVDYGQWVNLRLEVINKQARVILNGQTIYEVLIATAPVDIVGITYDFDGTGSVEYCRFSRVDGTVVFEDEF